MLFMGFKRWRCESPQQVSTFCVSKSHFLRRRNEDIEMPSTGCEYPAEGIFYTFLPTILLNCTSVMRGIPSDSASRFFAVPESGVFVMR